MQSTELLIKLREKVIPIGNFIDANMPKSTLGKEILQLMDELANAKQDDLSAALLASAKACLDAFNTYRIFVVDFSTRDATFSPAHVQLLSTLLECVHTSLHIQRDFYGEYLEHEEESVK